MSIGIRQCLVLVMLVGGLAGGPLASGASRPPESMEAMVTLQVSLRVLGYDPGPIDGVGGPRTLMALVSYAQDRGIALNQANVDVVMALLHAELYEKLRNGNRARELAH